VEIEGFDLLAELSLDLRWSWNHCADELWRLLDPKVWELTSNPWVILQTVSRDQLQSVAIKAANHSGGFMVPTNSSPVAALLCRLLPPGGGRLASTLGKQG